jgi:excisionase family DNA binding protein
MVQFPWRLAISSGMKTAPHSTSNRKPTPELTPLFCTVEEAGRMLGLSVPSIYALIVDGRLKSTKLGRSRRVLVKSIHALAEEAK